jgi:hypothetical protein
MPILFKPGVNIKDLRQTPFSLSIKDRANINIILDPLKEAGVIEDVPLGQPSLAVSPAFIVYRNVLNNKLILRYVVDLRRVNTKLYINAYPLPKQDNILIAIGGSAIFSILNITKSFF